MRYRIPFLLKVFLLAIATATSAGQTCNDAILATAPDSRFNDNGNGTVTDLATGLIWKRCAEGLSGADCAIGTPMQLAWKQALQYAANAEFAGSSLWRLPNKNELASLIERCCYNPAINALFFPNTPTSWFWSSSPYVGYYDRAWYVYFSYGDVYYTSKDYAWYVRLVRGG